MSWYCPWLVLILPWRSLDLAITLLWPYLDLELVLMVKIRSVTAEILLIWTNIDMTNVVWKMSPWQMESVLDVPLKFHQNRVSNNWDNANIEFLRWGDLNFFQTRIFFWIKIFSDQTFFGPKISLWTNNSFFLLNFFSTQHFFGCSIFNFQFHLYQNQC